MNQSILKNHNNLSEKLVPACTTRHNEAPSTEAHALTGHSGLCFLCYL